MTRDMKEAQLRDRQDELVRELEETNRELARTIELTRKASEIIPHARLVLSQVLGEAVGRPRVAPPRCICEHWQSNHKDAGLGSCTACMCPDFHPLTPRVAPPNPSPEQIERDFLERRGGR